MDFRVIIGLLIPFAGTCLGAGCVFFMKKELGDKVNKGLNGFAAGIMVAASFFSLILPAIEQSEDMGRLAFIPTVTGFLAGILFLLFLDVVVPHTHTGDHDEGVPSGLKKTTKLVFAVTLHNIPEGMAVGVVFANLIYGEIDMSLAAAFALSVGIALQNFPEGAIVSMPLKAEGMPRTKTFLIGVLSGIVEPIAAALTILAAGLVVTILPYFLSFAAGAMFYVVVEELVPEMGRGEHSNAGTVCFALGFVLMTALDVGLG